MSIKYRPEIDGLRAIAVIPVILFHMGFSWIKGGFYGVDVFFVISGFLITSNILRNLDQDKFSFKDFWIKRVKRILPALYTMIFIVLLSAPFLIFKGDIPALVTDAVPAIFSYSNFHSLFAFGNYWGGTAEQSFFLHCWSLSVEEQFYLFYPFLLYFLFRKKRNIKVWLVGIIVISFLFFIIGSYKFPQSTFYLLPTRAWELAAGALISIMKPNEVKNKFSGILSSFGLILIFLSYFVFPGSGSVSIFGILPVLGSAIFIFYSNQQSFVKSLISNPVIIYIGKISYSLYLWHWPIILISKYYEYRFTHLYLNIVIVCLTFVLSIFSYHLVEKKTRFASWTPKFALSLGGITVLSCIFLKSEWFDKTYKNDFNPVIAYTNYYDIRPNGKLMEDPTGVRFHNFNITKKDPKFKLAYKENGISMQGSETNPSIVLLGDSHGSMWAKTVEEVSMQLEKKFSSFSTPGALPFINLHDLSDQTSSNSFTKQERADYAKNLVSKLKLWRPELVIIICKWSSLKEQSMKDFQDLTALLDQIGIKTLILAQPPTIKHFSDKNCSQYLTYLGYDANGGAQFINDPDQEIVDKGNAKTKKIFLEHAKSHFVFETKPFLEKDGKILVVKNRDVLYTDEDHLSYQGTQIMKKALGEKIKSILLN